MIKRPFLWISSAFIAGILLAWNKIPLLYIILFAVLGWLFIYLLLFHIRKYINHMDYFIWGLPVLILMGYLAMGDRMKPPDMDAAFEEKITGTVTGEVAMTVKKPWGRAYYLKDNIITLPDGSTYTAEEMIVNQYDNLLYKGSGGHNELKHQKKREHQDSLKNQDSQEHNEHPKYLTGSRIAVSGTIRKFSQNTNPGGFNEHLYYKSQNISYKINAEEITIVDGGYSKFRHILNSIKEELIKVYETILPENEAGTLIAMILGEKHLLGEDINTLYQENGISHILAISGLHISMVGAAIYFVLRKLRLGLLASALISLVFVYGYGVLTNFSVSTNRAVVMYGMMLLARLIGKTFDILSALSLSALLILLHNPMELFQAGFLLSFGAVLGMALLLPCFNSLYKAKSGLLKGIYVSAAASAATQLLTLPFILYFFFQIPVYSVFINLIILPFTSLLMLSALLAGMAGIISIPFGIFLAGGANYILRFYEKICRIGSNLPGNLITAGRPDNIRIILYFAIMFVFIVTAARYKKKRFLILIPVAVVVLVFPKQREGLAVTMLDVGQGDAIFMETEKGTTYFIDGGSSDVNQVGRYRITPYLLSRGTDRLDYAIVTHTDADHISGLIELLERGQITIKRLILPDTTLKNEAYYKLEAMAMDNGIQLIYMAAGDMITDGKLRITVRHPPAGYRPASNNDYSTVLSVSYDEFDMLLTGDIEGKGEKELMKYLEGLSPEQADYDVLKVAHHGSKNSTSKEFLSVTKPEMSLISCGQNNSYGHPHPELMERLRDTDSKVYVTYESGAIQIVTDGSRVRIREYLKEGD